MKEHFEKKYSSIQFNGELNEEHGYPLGQSMPFWMCFICAMQDGIHQDFPGGVNGGRHEFEEKL